MLPLPVSARMHAHSLLVALAPARIRTHLHARLYRSTCHGGLCNGITILRGMMRRMMPYHTMCSPNNELSRTMQQQLDHQFALHHVAARHFHITWHASYLLIPNSQLHVMPCQVK